MKKETSNFIKTLYTRYIEVRDTKLKEFEQKQARTKLIISEMFQLIKSLKK